MLFRSLGVLFILSIAFQFQRIMSSLDASRAAWPKASAVLADRYMSSNIYLSGTELLAEVNSLQSWRDQYKAFKVSSQFDRQVGPSINLENMISGLVNQRIATFDSPIRHLVAKGPILEIVEKEAYRKSLEESSLGKLTKVVLGLKTPSFFEPITVAE